MIEAEWNASFREELRSFPYGRHDDQVDAASRAHMVLTSAKAPMRINPANVRPFGVVTGGAVETRAWYLQEGESAEDRLTRLERRAKTLHAVNLDHEDLPEGAIMMGSSNFRVGG
jgi:hypothetical protein